MNIVATHVCETSEFVAEIPEVTRSFEAEAQGLSEILEMVGEFDAAEAALALADMHTEVDVSADTVSVLLDEVLEALVAIRFSSKNTPRWQVWDHETYMPRYAGTVPGSQNCESGSAADFSTGLWAPWARPPPRNERGWSNTARGKLTFILEW